MLWGERAGWVGLGGWEGVVRVTSGLWPSLFCSVPSCSCLWSTYYVAGIALAAGETEMAETDKVCAFRS